MPVDLLLQRGHPVAQALGHLPQVLHVEGHPRRLHPGQHRRQWELHIGEELSQSRPLHPFPHHRGQQSHGCGRARHRTCRVGEQLPLQVVPGLDLLDHIEPQVPLAQVSQRIGRLRGIEQVGGEQGVECHPGQPPVGGQQRGLEVLGVVDELRRVRVRQPPFRPSRQLWERHENSLAASCRQPQPPDRTAVHLQRHRLRGIGVQEHPQFLGRSGPDVQRGPLDRGLGRPLQLLQPLQQRPELQRVEQPANGVRVPRPHLAVLRPHGQRQVRVQPDQLLVPHQHVPRPFDPGAHPGLELLRVSKQLLDAAVGLDELGGGLLPDPGNARDVVREIALQRHVVQILLGWQAEPLGHRVDVIGDDVRDAPPVEHHADARPDHLEEVAVGGHDDRFQPLLHRSQGQRGDGVVRLVALNLHDGDGHGLQDLPDQPQLLAELVWGLGPPGLVIGVLLQPDCGPPLVERHRQEVRLLLAQELDQHGGESVHRVGQLAAGGGQIGGQGEEGPVGKAVSVQDEEPPRRHCGDCNSPR